MIFVFRIISTARKRSLEQGNVFTGVCLSTARGLCPSMHHRSHDRGSLSRGVFCPGGQSLSKGSSSLSRGVSVQGGSLSRGSLVPGGLVSVREGLCPGGPPDRDPPYGNERVVRILRSTRPLPLP